MHSEDRIAAVRGWVVAVPLKKPWQISLYAAKERNHLLVEVRTHGGVAGYGEASPAPAFMGEEAFPAAEVVARFLAPVVVGHSAFDLEAIHLAMNRAIQGSGAAKAAVDLAIHDVLGRLVGRPVCDLLGGRVREAVPVSWVVGIQDPAGVLEEVKPFLDLGVGTYKVKVGRGPAEDRRLLEAVREAVGRGARLRVDANQGYTVDAAIKAFRAMEAFDLEAIEQPVPASDLMGLRAVAEALDTPVVADEAVFGLHDALAVIQARAADILNIKVGKVGGLHPARKIAALAEAAHLPCTVGSNLELGVGSAASIHFAGSTGVATYPHDLLIGPFLHAHDLVTEPLMIRDGSVAVPGGCGLGVEPAPRWLP